MVLLHCLDSSPPGSSCSTQVQHLYIEWSHSLSALFLELTHLTRAENWQCQSWEHILYMNQTGFFENLGTVAIIFQSIYNRTIKIATSCYYEKVQKILDPFKPKSNFQTPTGRGKSCPLLSQGIFVHGGREWCFVTLFLLCASVVAGGCSMRNALHRGVTLNPSSN